MKKKYRKLKSLKFLYEISEDGELRNVKSKKIVHGHVEKTGYRRVRIENKCLGGVIRTSIHQLVAEAWVENPNPDEFNIVNHLDANKLNNNASNLEWTNHSGNMKHAYALGINRGPLRKHSVETRKKVTNGEIEFESISAAGKWLASKNLVQNWQSGVAGISAVINGRRNTIGGYEWKII